MAEGRQVHALVLAAGEGRRFGACKQLASAGGVPLLARVLAHVQRAPVASVTVALGARHEDIAPMCRTAGVDIVVNPRFRDGLAGTIRRGVHALAARLDQPGAALLLALGDQPGATAEHLQALVAAHGAAGGLVASAYDGVVGAPAIFPAAFRAELLALTGDRGAGALLARHAPVTVPLPRFADVDTPADLARFTEEEGLS